MVQSDNIRDAQELTSEFISELMTPGEELQSSKNKFHDIKSMVDEESILNFDISVLGDCGTTKHIDTAGEKLIKELTSLKSKIILPYYYLQKIVDRMSELEAYVYYVSLDKFDSPTTFVSLVCTMKQMSEIMSTMTSTLRNSALLSIYTKFLEVGCREGIDPNEAYKIFYDNYELLLSPIDFVYELEEGWIRLASKLSNKGNHDRAVLHFAFISHNIRKLLILSSKNGISSKKGNGIAWR